MGEVDEDELYAALDWLRERQEAIETALAKRHLKGGNLVLYDASSSYVEGRCCALAKRGYNRDGKKGMLFSCCCRKPQAVERRNASHHCSGRVGQPIRRFVRAGSR